MRTWKPILAALVIFLAGAVIGALLPTRAPDLVPSKERPDRGDRPRRGGGPAPRPPWNPVLSSEQVQEICGRMTRDLSLSPAQSNQIHLVIQEGQVRMKAIADEFLPRTREEFHRTREAIKAVLTPEQLQKFEDEWRNREARWRNRTNTVDPDRPFRGGNQDPRDMKRGFEGHPPPPPEE